MIIDLERDEMFPMTGEYNCCWSLNKIQFLIFWQVVLWMKLLNYLWAINVTLRFLLHQWMIEALFLVLGKMRKSKTRFFQKILGNITQWQKQGLFLMLEDTQRTQVWNFQQFLPQEFHELKGFPISSPVIFIFKTPCFLPMFSRSSPIFWKRKNVLKVWHISLVQCRHVSFKNFWRSGVKTRLTA